MHAEHPLQAEHRSLGESDPCQPHTDNAKRLRDVLDTFDRTRISNVSSSEAWQTYELLPESARSTPIKKALISRLHPSSKAVDALRTIRVLQSMPEEDRDVERLSAASSAALKLGYTAKALAFNGRALSMVASSHRASEEAAFNTSADLLLHALAFEQWQLAFHVWITTSECNEYSPCSASSESHWRRIMRDRFDNIRELDGKVYSLLSFADFYPEVLCGKAVGVLLTELVSAVFSRQQTFGPERDLFVVESMRKFGLCTGTIYDHACSAILRTNSPTREQRSLAFQMYEKYRSDRALRGDFRPAATLLQSLAHAAVAAENDDMVQQLVLDWQNCYLTFSVRFAMQVMIWHSRRAETKRIEEIISEHLSHLPKKHSGLFRPLLHADALRAGPVAVEERMQWMQTAHHVDLDIQCWNILLHAYQKVDDLDGALDCMQRLLAAGFVPTEYTIGTLMAVAADRGDTGLARPLVSYALNRGISLTPPILEALALAFINDDNISKAMDMAEELTPGFEQQSTRMWTQIIVANCVRGKYMRALKSSRRMRELGVPFDTHTYAAVLRIFLDQHRFAHAQRIMSYFMPKENIKPTAFHYAILIRAYARDRRINRALEYYAEMQNAKIKPSYSVKLAMLELQALSASKNTSTDQSNEALKQFNVPEELLEEYASGYDSEMIASREPQIYMRESSLPMAHPMAYFDTMLSIYGNMGAFQAVRGLIMKYQDSETRLEYHSSAPHQPLNLLHQIMRMRLQMDDHASVEQYWHLSLQTALARARAVAPSFWAYKDPDALFQSIRRTQKANAEYPGAYRPIPAAHQFILARHLAVYIRSLNRQRDYSRILTALNEYTRAGFQLDYLNWNDYIRILVRRGSLLEAFLLTEGALMQGFRGWHHNESLQAARWRTATGRNPPGLLFIGGKNHAPLQAGGRKQRTIPQEIMEHFMTVERQRDQQEGLVRPPEEIEQSAESTARRTLGRHSQHLQPTYATMIQLRRAMESLVVAGGRELERKPLFGARHVLGQAGVEMPEEPESEDAAEQREREDGNDENDEHPDAHEDTPTSDTPGRKAADLLEEIRERCPSTVYAITHLPAADEGYAKQVLETVGGPRGKNVLMTRLRRPRKRRYGNVFVREGMGERE